MRWEETQESVRGAKEVRAIKILKCLLVSAQVLKARTDTRPPPAPWELQQTRLQATDPLPPSRLPFDGRPPSGEL